MWNCAKNMKKCLFASSTFKSQNFAQILENFAQSCNFTTSAFRSSDRIELNMSHKGPVQAILGAISANPGPLGAQDQDRIRALPGKVRGSRKQYPAVLQVLQLNPFQIAISAQIWPNLSTSDQIYPNLSLLRKIPSPSQYPALPHSSTGTAPIILDGRIQTPSFLPAWGD